MYKLVNYAWVKYMCRELIALFIYIVLLLLKLFIILDLTKYVMWYEYEYLFYLPSSVGGNSFSFQLCLHGIKELIIISEKKIVYSRVLWEMPDRILFLFPMQNERYTCANNEELPDQGTHSAL